ncbi:MAG: hypothetical protein ACHQUA_01185, partial [Microgenomates group bacterium]
VVSLLLFSLSFYSSSARLLFAHHHESGLNGGVHPCCQPLVASFIPNVNLDFVNQNHIFKSEKSLTLTPLLVIDNKSIRSPPITTS